MSRKMQRTRERAYQIWEEEGRPGGREIDHWLQAEGELHEGVDAEDTQPGGRDTLAQDDPAEAIAADAANSLQVGSDPEQAAQKLSEGNERAYGPSGSTQ